MTKPDDIVEPTVRQTSAPAVRHMRSSNDPFAPVMRSVIGLVSESAGLVRHVAALGIVLVFDAGTTPRRRPTAPPMPAPDATNIIRFPAARTTKPRK